MPSLSLDPLEQEDGPVQTEGQNFQSSALREGIVTFRWRVQEISWGRSDGNKHHAHPFLPSDF